MRRSWIAEKGGRSSAGAAAADSLPFSPPLPRRPAYSTSLSLSPRNGAAVASISRAPPPPTLPKWSTLHLWLLLRFSLPRARSLAPSRSSACAQPRAPANSVVDLPPPIPPRLTRLATISIFFFHSSTTRASPVVIGYHPATLIYRAPFLPPRAERAAARSDGGCFRVAALTLSPRNVPLCSGSTNYTRGNVAEDR